uniref:Uncharacterized protein n=1 Tax=mine drainage metagenome TaxID=410659 RepID=E6PQ86_9ZZZZ
MPWETAINLSPAEVLAFCVAAGELEGGKFDWRSMSWEKPR